VEEGNGTGNREGTGIVNQTPVAERSQSGGNATESKGNGTPRAN